MTSALILNLDDGVDMAGLELDNKVLDSLAMEDELLSKEAMTSSEDGESFLSQLLSDKPIALSEDAGEPEDDPLLAAGGKVEASSLTALEKIAYSFQNLNSFCPDSLSDTPDQDLYSAEVGAEEFSFSFKPKFKAWFELAQEQQSSSLSQTSFVSGHAAGLSPTGIFVSYVSKRLALHSTKRSNCAALSFDAAARVIAFNDQKTIRCELFFGNAQIGQSIYAQEELHEACSLLSQDLENLYLNTVFLPQLIEKAKKNPGLKFEVLLQHQGFFAQVDLEELVAQLKLATPPNVEYAVAETDSLDSFSSVKEQALESQVKAISTVRDHLKMRKIERLLASQPKEVVALMWDSVSMWLKGDSTVQLTAEDRDCHAPRAQRAFIECLGRQAENFSSAGIPLMA